MGRRRWAALAWRYGRPVRWTAVGVCLLFALLSSIGPADPVATRSVTVAARDIPAGATLQADDLTTATTALALGTPVPSELVGEVTRGPVGTGEPVTATRIAPGGLVSPTPGTVVFPLALADDRIAALLEPGQRVDVIVTPDALHDGEPQVLAQDVEVVAVPANGESFASPRSGAVVLLSVPSPAAADLAGIRTGDHVSVAIR